LKEIADNPLIGVEYDQFSTSGVDADVRLIPGTIHNVLLQTLYTGGILSFMGLVTVYFYLEVKALTSLLRGKNRSGLTIGLAECVLAFILMDQFQDAKYQREKWLIVGIMICSVWELTTNVNYRDQLK